MIKTKRSKNNQPGLLLAFIAIFLLAAFLSSCTGEQKPKVYRVGVLSGLEFVTSITDGFKEGMTELGYIEGENIVYDVQHTDFDMEAYRSILQKFVADKVDLILVYPTEATIEAKTATEGTGIPVVFAFALIEDMGIVDSIREPGGNITGVRYPGTDVALKRFEILRELVPDAKRILMPYQRGYPIVQPQLEILRPVAEEAGITLIDAPVDNGAELETVFQEYVTPDGVSVDAILTLVEPLAVATDAYPVIVSFAEEHQIPFGGVYVPGGDYRSLFGVNVDVKKSGYLSAPLADKIFQGIDPGTIPIVSAEPYLEIDYQMVEKLKLEAPEGLLVLADKVYR